MMNKKLSINLVLCLGCFSLLGVVPNSRYQYAADGEYDDLLILPWVASKSGNPTIEFQYPKCAEKQEVSERYADSTLFNGVIKLVEGNVVTTFMISMHNGTDDFQTELNKLLSASDTELKSSTFLRSIASLAGRKDILDYGTTKVGGKTAFWSITKMERRIQNQVIYRGVQKIHIIPLRDKKRFVAAMYAVGVLGVDEFPYDDYKAFSRVGEKFIKSIRVKDKWSLW